MRSYSVDPTAAREAGSSNFITTTGPYVGTFTRAEGVRAQSGAEGVEFTFRSNDGQTADYLSLWTHNTSGEPIYGFKVLQALMVCMKTRDANPTPGEVVRHDGKREQATVYPELINKPIGLLLQKEPYTKNNGDEGFRFVIFNGFESSTRLTASEILDRAQTPEQLDQWVANLKDRPKQPPRNQQAGQNSYANATGAQTSGAPVGMGFDDDDIPF